MWILIQKETSVKLIIIIAASKLGIEYKDNISLILTFGTNIKVRITAVDVNIPSASIPCSANIDVVFQGKRDKRHHYNRYA